MSSKKAGLTASDQEAVDMAYSAANDGAGEVACNLLGHNCTGPVRGKERKRLLKELKDWGMQEHAGVLGAKDPAGSLADRLWSDPAFVRDMVLDRIYSPDPAAYLRRVKRIEQLISHVDWADVIAEQEVEMARVLK